MMAFHARAGVVLVTGAMLTVGFLACSSKSDGGGDGTQPGQQDAEPLFRALQGDLVKTCGGPNGTCHVRGTYRSAPTWLADPDPYVSAKKYRGILPATHDVGDSIILTQVAHEGPALKDTPNLYERVAAWLQAEVPPPPLPNTGAFSVTSGYNSIPLDTVISGLTGARLTFLATDSNGVLTLNALRLYAPQNANVKIDSPFFVILPRSGKVNADPQVNGFTGELTIPAGTSAQLFSGKMILLRWDTAGQLKVVFQKIESTPGQGPATGCTALDAFTKNAEPAMRAQVDEIAVYQGDAGPDDGGPPEGTVVGQNSCVGCHAQEPPADQAPSPAVQAMDLRGIDTDPAKACGQARAWINFQQRDQSTILLNPQGKANPKHPIKPLDASDPIVTGLAAWVNAEQP